MYGREEIGGERRAKGANHVVPHHPLAMGGSWPTREQRVLQAMGLTASSTASPCGPRPGLSSRALPRFFGLYLGRPNSDFESVSRLRTVTLSRTTKIIQLWKKVEKSSRKSSMKSTQWKRTKSSIVNLFGLETLWMSNRNDRNSIRN